MSPDLKIGLPTGVLSLHFELAGNPATFSCNRLSTLHHTPGLRVTGFICFTVLLVINLVQPPDGKQSSGCQRSKTYHHVCFRSQSFGFADSCIERLDFPSVGGRALGTGPIG